MAYPDDVPDISISDDISEIRIEGSSFRSLGLGRLRLVEQKILRYEAGEVAHIENVLKGEKRTRDHRRLKRIEEMLRVEEERTEETEKDLQTTERFELQKESEEKVSEESTLDVGVTVSYGGFVDVEASLQASRTDASERSDRTATNYAREVIEKTVSKIQERVREERVRTTIEEFEERNIHIIENIAADAEHVVGIYRWVDKVYEAQVFDYGFRLLFEFLIPEPAALLRHTFENPQADEALGTEPLEPIYTDLTSEEDPPPSEKLKPSYLGPDNFQDYVADYKALSVKPPPEMYLQQAFLFNASNTTDLVNEQNDVQTKKVTIPRGYRAKSAQISVRLPFQSFAWHRGYEPDHPNPRVTYNTAHYDTLNSVGGVHYRESVAVSVGKSKTIYWPSDHTHYFEADLRTDDGSGGYEIEKDDVGELPIMIEARWRTTWEVSIEVIFELADQGLAEWQHQTYDAILQAYLQQKAEYEERKRARAVQQGIAISGRNPAMNREVEQTELKRGALTLLMHEVSPTPLLLADFGSIERPSVDGVEGPPEIGFDEAKREAQHIQFLEQAFEWRHMMYSFYPYYWTNRDSWPELQQAEDTDPLHARFLAAGAARVIVPVRPGYGDWLDYYLVHGVPYGGTNPPDATSPEFVDIVTELRELQGYDGIEREGTLTVTNGSDTVSGVGTCFVVSNDDPDDDDRETNDENRRIYIDMMPYRIARVISKTRIRLAEPYQNSSMLPNEIRRGVPYAMGATFVGAPWEVKIPTSLVILEKRTDTVDDLTFGVPEEEPAASPSGSES